MATKPASSLWGAKVEQSAFVLIWAWFLSCTSHHRSRISPPYTVCSRANDGRAISTESRPVSAEIFREIREARAEGEPRVLATVARTRGSTPRKAGATMLLRPDGTFPGTIGGGCGEAEVWQDAMDTMADGMPRLTVVDLTEPVDGDDKICGGIMEVFVERVTQ